MKDRWVSCLYLLRYLLDAYIRRNKRDFLWGVDILSIECTSRGCCTLIVVVGSVSYSQENCLRQNLTSYYSGNVLLLLSRCTFKYYIILIISWEPTNVSHGPRSEVSPYLVTWYMDSNSTSFTNIAYTSFYYGNGGPEKGRFFLFFFYGETTAAGVKYLASETVQGTSLAFQGIDNVHSSDRLPLGVFGVGDSITYHVLQEYLENTSCLLVDESRDTLHATTTSETPDGRFRDSLDVIAKDFPVTFRSSFS